MGTVEGKKQEKRRALLEAAYDLFLERGAAKTSVEDITSRAKVAKGTFYLYFQDKGAVMQALLGRVSYQLLSNACEAVEKQTELENFPDKMVAVIDHIIEALRKDTLVLKFLEHNFIWPGLDQIEASREAEPLMRKLLNVVLTSPEMAGRTVQDLLHMAVGGKAEHLIPLSADDIETLGADGAGRAQQRDFLSHKESISC